MLYATMAGRIVGKAFWTETYAGLGGVWGDWSEWRSRYLRVSTSIDASRWRWGLGLPQSVTDNLQNSPENSLHAGARSYIHYAWTKMTYDLDDGSLLTWWVRNPKYEAEYHLF
jgi:hypothetical protein